ncbi:uncharacterized protein LOC132903786 [Amyelois transitella]|uniref:uncharacterized protein LOC132903786 n=1 Tax=Amyelois transitella TaxID=680683 RepID=UPI00298FE035|nr:uncharacterized protein LOC132903786 [Amyelois transitella]
MNLEDMYQVMKGASEVDGVRYDVVETWFRKCDIIDGKFISDEFFERSYLRLCPNKEPIGLAPFIQLLGIMSRETKLDIKLFLTKFERVRVEIVQEIKEKCVNKPYAYS